MGRTNHIRIPHSLTTQSKRGAAPGTLSHVGGRKMEQSQVQGLRYARDRCEERNATDGRSLPLPEKGESLWVNVDGVHDPELIGAIGVQFNLHHLLLEDTMNTTQRPKIEETGDSLFMALKMLHFNPARARLEVEHMSIMLGEGFLLTFQEQPQDAFDEIRSQLREGKGKLRERGLDYLAYRLLDAVVDEYLHVITAVGEEVEEIEELFLKDSDTRFLRSVHRLRQELLFVRRAVAPMRDVVGHLLRMESNLVGDAMEPYLRDLSDHVGQALDAVDTFREMLSNMLDNELSLSGHRLNAVMKMLTIVATIFIPLTFIAGVYGMNFRHMPELSQPWGYPAALGMMLAVGMGMVVYFKRRRWL